MARLRWRRSRDPSITLVVFISLSPAGPYVQAEFRGPAWLVESDRATAEAAAASRCLAYQIDQKFPGCGDGR